MIGPDKDKSIAAIIVSKALPKTKEVSNLEADFEDAKTAVFEEFIEAIEKKDAKALKASFMAIMDMCSEESQYSETEQSEEA